MNGPYRIAVVRALHLGDLLVAVPALRSIRAGYPDAEIALIGLPWAEEFCTRFRLYIDRFVPFEGHPGISEVKLETQRASAFIKAQQDYRYDLAVQMHGSGTTSTSFVRDLHAACTVGYYDAAASPPQLANTWHENGCALLLPYPSTEPEVSRNMGLAQALGCPDLGLDLEFPLTEHDRLEANHLLDGLDLARRPRLIGLHPGSKRPAQRWPAMSLAALGDALAHELDASIVLTGGAGEQALAREVGDRMKTPAHVLAGQTSLGSLAALIERCDLFISNDTGPAHLAEAVDTRSLTLFGPGDYARWAPLSSTRHQAIRNPVECSPCSFWDCPIDHRCLTEIRPHDVLHLASQMLTAEVAA